MKKFNIDWKIEERELKDLKEWSKNPRKITEEDFELLKKGIEERGFHDILKIDSDGTIISGHQRKRALLDLGIKSVKVMVPQRELTEKERDIVAIESNRHRGVFDFDILANQFDQDTLLNSGFKDFELGFFSEATDEKDTDTLNETMTSYLDGNVRQVTFYFSVEEFEALLPRLDKVMEETGVKSHTEVLLHILKHYEDTHSK